MQATAAEDPNKPRPGPAERKDKGKEKKSEKEHRERGAGAYEREREGSPLDDEEFPLAIEALLGPGDMLYIPPNWWHEVEAVNVSLSVNAWSNSGESEAMEEVFSIFV